MSKEKVEKKVKRRRRRLGDRKEGRRLRTIAPITRVACCIMPTRTGATNQMRDKFDVSAVERYVREKKAEGMKNFTTMHVLLAAYVRTVSQMPALNRFIAGYKVFARNDIQIALTIKKEMTLESPDTVIKLTTDPSATAGDIYSALQHEIDTYREQKTGGLDKVVKVLNYIPGIMLRGTINIIRFIDYMGLLPRFLTNVSPFHCSLYITSMGSLGIPPVHHHLYDFGTCPVFIAFGAKQRCYELNAKGEAVKKEYVEYTVNMDERICDGFYYAAALKKLRRYLRDPWQLDVPPETVVEDID